MTDTTEISQEAARYSIEALRLLEAQLDGWHRLMNPLSPDYAPDFRPSLEAVQAAAYAAYAAIAAAGGR